MNVAELSDAERTLATAPRGLLTTAKARRPSQGLRAEVESACPVHPSRPGMPRAAFPAAELVARGLERPRRMDADRAERVEAAAALMVAEVELRRAQARGDRVALARWRAELEALELWARVLIQGWDTASAKSCPGSSSGGSPRAMARI